MISRNLGISARNDYAMLERDYGYRELSREELAAILKPNIERFEGIVFNEAYCRK